MSEVIKPVEFSANEALKVCPFCAEKIQPEAVICRYCNKAQKPPSDRGNTKAIIITVVVVAVAILVISIVAANRPGAFNGKNYDLYAAMTLYGSAETHSAADSVVDKIAKQAEISHSKAEKIAIVCAQNHIALETCVSLGYATVNMDRLKERGVAP